MADEPAGVAISLLSAYLEFRRLERKTNPKASLIHALFLLFALVVGFGPLFGLIIAVVVVPLAAMIFRRWPNGARILVGLDILLKSLIFLVILFTAFVLRIKLYGGGQVGYGDRLQYQGHDITPLGYWYLSTYLLACSSVVFAISLIVALYAKSR